MSKPLATKVSKPLTENVQIGPISHFLSQVSFHLLVLLSLSHTGHWKFNMAPHGKELSEDLKKKRIVALHEDGIGYKKIAKTLKLSCSAVAKTIQWFNRKGSTQNKPRHGRPKNLSACAQRHIRRLCLRNRCMSAASIAAEVEGGGGGGSACPYSDHTLHITSNWSTWLSFQKEDFPKMMHKKACKQFAEDEQTKDMDYWNHVLWSDETKVNLFGSDGVKHVWWQPGKEYKDKCVLPTVKHGGESVMVWGCMSAAGTGELQFIEGTMNANMYCDILKQSMIPSLWRLGRSAVFQHDNNHCLHISRPKPYWASVGYPQTEGGETQGL